MVWIVLLYYMYVSSYKNTRLVVSCTAVENDMIHYFVPSSPPSWPIPISVRVFLASIITIPVALTLWFYHAHSTVVEFPYSCSITKPQLARFSSIV